MSIELNWVDYGFLIIVLLSIIFGLFRGFIRGVVSLIFLLAAVYLAVKYSPQLAAHFAGNAAREHTISYLLLAGMFLLIFIVTIVIGGLVGYFLNLAFQFGGLGFINSLLGALFGIVRGALIIIAIIYLVQLTPTAKERIWQESTLVKYFQPAVDWLENNSSSVLETLKNNHKHLLKH